MLRYVLFSLMIRGNIMCKIETSNFIAFHPGYYVAEVIADLEMSHSDFAKRLGVTPKHLCKLLTGKT